MIATPAQLAEMNKAQVDALYALSHTMFSATERLIDLNLAAVRAMMEESATQAQALAGAKDAQEVVAMTGSLAQPSVEKAVAYSRNVYNIASNAGAELSKILEAQVVEANKRVADIVDFAAKNAPAGSESAVGAVKSALSMATTAFDTFSKAAKQTVDIVESNVTAATDATMKAASAAGDTVKVKPSRKGS